jgi:hypothetical protein
MNPLDIHLKFPDEATAIALFVKESVWLKYTDENKKVCYVDALGYLTDVIGLIYKPTGVNLKDKDGYEYNEMVDVGGWHVNLRGQLPVEIELYKITVTGIPHRIWD